MPSNWLEILLVVVLFIITFQPAYIASRRLPPLWDEIALDEESETYGSFRILSDVHLDDTSSFLIEEWFDGPHKLFRMDVLPEHYSGPGAQNMVYGVKKSFISDGGTQECFYFEPFKCHSLNRDCSSKPQLNNTLHNFGLAELFRRFPKSSTSQYSPLMGGVGSIWLEALNSGVEPVFRPGKDSLPSARLRQGGMSKFEVLRKFDRYTFKSTDKFPYKLEFYFFASGDKNDGSDSDTSSPSDDDSQRPNGLVSIHVIDPDFKTTKMMVRIIELAASIQMPVSVSKGSQMGGKGLFELPLGYGCSRKRSESLGEIHYKPPRNCFHSAMQPHTCYLEADTWLPNDLASDTDIDQWRHHSTSIRIVAGRLLDHSYLTVEERDFAPVQEEPELNLDTLDFDETPTDADAIIEPSADQNKGVAIRRVKRVWDMGHFDDKDVSERQAPVPMYFGLIDHLRKCATVDHAQLNELPNIEFSLILPDDTSQQDKGGAGSNSSTNSGASSSNEQMRTSTRTIGLTLVDHLMMSELFEQLEGYKLVREIAEPWLKYQTIIQERRVDSFEFRDHNGQVAWVGPVSLIREFHYIATTSIDVASIEEPQDPRFNSSQPDVPADALRVKLTIIPYTKQLDRQLGRIQLIMSPGLLVDEAYLHRDLDIEPCFKENLARVGSINSKTTTKMTRRDEMMQQVLLASSSAQHQASFDFRLVYPLETPLPSELNASARSKIYAGFLRNLASISLLSTGESRRLNLLQVTHLSVDIEPELVRLTGTLNEWPESFNYIKHAASRPVPNSNVKVFLREPKPNVELCARSCSHYECPVFLYDAISGLCELLEWTNQLSHKKQQQQLKLEYLGDYRSSAYERKSEAKPGADPRLVLQHISESIQDEMGADDETNELAIELDVGSSTKLVLLPSSLQLGNERWHQDQLMLRGANLAAKMAAASAGKDQGANETSLNFDFASGSSVQDLARSSHLGIELEFGYFARKRKFTLGHSQNREHFPIDEAKHLSEDECKQLCSENDCRSYSYCVYDSSCIISKLSTDNEIREASEDEDFCSLMVIDHLSKFHANTKGLIGSEALARMYSQQSTSLKIMLEFESQRDCANACLEFKDFTCRSLFFCRPQDQIAATGGGGGNCFLFADRHSARIIGAETTQQPTPTQGASDVVTDNNNNNCDYYQRSYVADYHQYHGKRLTPASSKQVESIEILVGVGAEDCASECSRLAAGEDDQRASICRAFHVCLGTSADGGGSKPKRGKRQQLMCGLLTEDLNRLRSTGSSDSVTIKAKERLTDGPKCTAFIRIAAGIDGGNSISGGQATDNSSSAAAAHPSGLDLEQTSTASRGGNFIRGVLIILLGLAIGYSLGWLVWR